MSINTKTIFWLDCDKCGMSSEKIDISSCATNAKDARERAQKVGWKVVEMVEGTDKLPVPRQFSVCADCMAKLVNEEAKRKVVAK